MSEKSLIFTIENFQSISSASLVINGVTCLVGPGNRGKTAIIRALGSLLYNDWQQSFMRRGAKYCRLKLEFPVSDVHGVEYIELYKSSKDNKYTISYRDGTVKEYPKTGKTVPEEIKAIGFSLVETERGDRFNLNIQKQFDPQFMLGSADVSLTGFLNSIFNLDRYERALRDINKDYKDKVHEHDKLIGRNLELDLELEPLFNRRDALLDDKNVVSKLIDDFNSLVDKIEYIDNGIRIINAIDTVECDIINVESDLSFLRFILSFFSRCEGVMISFQEIIKLESSIASVNSYLVIGEQVVQLIKQCHLIIFPLLQKVEILEGINKNIAKVVCLVNEYNNSVATKKIVDTLKVYLKNLDVLCNIEFLSKNINSIRDRICNGFKVISRINSGIEYVSKLDNALLKIKDVILGLYVFKKVNGIDDEYNNITGYIFSVGEAHKEFTSLHKRILNLVGKCPTCGGNLNENMPCD